MRKRILVCMAVLFILAIQHASINAHPSTQAHLLGNYSHCHYDEFGTPVFVSGLGGEHVKWGIHEDHHTNGTSLYYRFASQTSPSAANQMKVTTGATYWRECGGYITNVGTAYVPGAVVGLVEDIYDSRLQMVAGVTCNNGDDDSMGHRIRWKLHINTYYSQYFSNATIAHEFGHAYGLNDLYSAANKDTLMYGISDRTVVAPQRSSDIKGWRVITGRHTTHTFNSAGFCTDCGGPRR